MGSVNSISTQGLKLLQERIQEGIEYIRGQRVTLFQRRVSATSKDAPLCVTVVRMSL
jgi:hypothetical protein